MIMYIKRETNHGNEQHAGKQGLTPPKREGFLPNYLDQMQSRGFGEKGGESHLGDVLPTIEVEVPNLNL